MKIYVYITLFSLVEICQGFPTETLKLWETFKEKHSKTYRNTQEENRRVEIFSQNLEKIARHNELFDKGLKTYKLGITRFADKTEDEFKSYLKLQGKNPGKKYSTDFVSDDFPESVDWRENGAVTPIKDQGDCGSCWAFSTVAAIESRHFIKHGELVALSEQELVDCDWDNGNMGCFGGLMDLAFEYIMYQGIAKEEDYPYLAKYNECKSEEVARAPIDVHSYFFIFPHNETGLQSAVSKGPVSAAVDASYFALYESGVLSEDLCMNDIEYLNHGVVVIGYGSTEEGVDYWLVKNSWGESWGENGYIRIARNQDNMCGLATEACYPNM